MTNQERTMNILKLLAIVGILLSPIHGMDMDLDPQGPGQGPYITVNPENINSCLDNVPQDTTRLTVEFPETLDDYNVKDYFHFGHGLLKLHGLRELLIVDHSWTFLSEAILNFVSNRDCGVKKLTFQSSKFFWNPSHPNFKNRMDSCLLNKDIHITFENCVISYDGSSPNEGKDLRDWLVRLKNRDQLGEVGSLPGVEGKQVYHV